MRVLMIGLSSNKGGIESFALNYNRRLIKKGIVFDYICMGEELAYEDEINTLGGIVYKIPYVNRHPILCFSSLLRIIRKYETVHINMLSAANILPLISARICRSKKIIAHSHNSSTEGAIRFLLHYFNKPIVSIIATDYFSCGDDAARWLFLPSIYKNKKYKLIHNAVNIDDYAYDVEFRKQFRDKYNIAKDDIVIGSVGRITLQKNSEFFIDILNSVCKKNKNTKLIIAGQPEGNYIDKLNKKISLYKLEKNVIFLGSRNDVNKLYSVFDVFCMPSLYEGLSLTAIESQASAITCLFSDKMDQKTKITKYVHFLPITDSNYWAKKILEYSSERVYDKKYIRDSFLKNGYDIEAETISLENIYKRV